MEVLEQLLPILFKRFALREGSGGAGAQRGGFGVHYEVELLRGRGARLVRDGPRPLRPAGRAGRRATARPTSCEITRAGETFIPPNTSKDQDIAAQAGDRVEVLTPGGGGYGDPFRASPSWSRATCATSTSMPPKRPRPMAWCSKPTPRSTSKPPNDCAAARGRRSALAVNVVSIG